MNRMMKMNSLIWFIIILSANVCVDARISIKGRPNNDENANKTMYMVYIGSWTQCQSIQERNKTIQNKEHNLIEFILVNTHTQIDNVNGVTYSAQVGIQRRQVKCRERSGKFVEKMYCGQSIHNVVNIRLCIVRTDCELTGWSDWIQNDNREIVRTRNVTTLPQGGGRACGPLVEVKHIIDDGEAQWSPGPWGPCIVEGDTDAAVEEAVWSPWGAGVSTGVCGGGRQRRDIKCTTRHGHILANVHCSNQHMPPIQQPCEVPCPRDCRAGEWSDWTPCRPLAGCPMYPVQELTAVGFSIRHRRALNPGDPTGVPCGALEEVRTCSTPKCAVWQPGPWGPCTLNDEHAKCGPGVRERRLTCLDLDGNEAPSTWCSGKPPASREWCRAACPGDCVVSSWGPWGPCSSPCSELGRTAPTRTRVRHIIAHPLPEGWQCPPPEQLIQNESCNTHACHTYSWTTMPWSECTKTNNTHLLDNDEGYDDTENPMNDENDCRENGVQLRDVWCLQDNEKKVKDSMCSPLEKPSTKRVCSRWCSVQCVLGPWSEWSPCRKTCKIVSQVRVRSVQGGCGAPLQRRVCPPPLSCFDLIPRIEKPSRPTWRASVWSECVLWPGTTNGIQTRSIWCWSSGSMIEARLCSGQVAPPMSRSCNAISPHNGVKREERCKVVCEDPYTPADDPREGCNCNGYYLELLPSNSDCILPYGSECGRGILLKAAICRGPDNEITHIDICKRNVDIKKDESLIGYEWDDDFPDHLRTSCRVECPVDCEMTRWSEWTTCSHGFRQRSRAVLVAPSSGGRSCGELVQNAVCEETKAIWHVEPWGVCVPTQPPCGEAYSNRTVSCVSARSHAVKLPESACLAENKPPESVRCRAPCPDDCVVSQWSEWSPCVKSGRTFRRDRTRVVLRPPTQVTSSTASPSTCPALVQTKPCGSPLQAVKAAWRATQWDHCQPLGGSPCGEGTTRRTITCQSQNGDIIEDIHCKDLPHPGESVQWCYVTCPTDCEGGEWSQWDFTECSCGKEDGYAIRNRSIIVSASGTGRDCGALTQRIPCPVRPCIYETHDKDTNTCKLMLHDTYEDGNETGWACGHGTIVGNTDCILYIELNDKTTTTSLSDWRCLTAEVHKITAPQLIPELGVCNVRCDCRDKVDSDIKDEAWSDWSECVAGTKFRKRISISCDTNQRYQINQYVNCTQPAETESPEYDSEFTVEYNDEALIDHDGPTEIYFKLYVGNESAYHQRTILTIILLTLMTLTLFFGIFISCIFKKQPIEKV